MAAAQATVVVTKVVPGGGGDSTRVYGTITFSAAYAAGGDYILPSQLGLEIIDSIFFGPATVTAGSTTAQLVAVNKSTVLPVNGTTKLLIQLFISNTTAVFAETTTADNSTYSCYFEAYGA